MSSKNVYVKSLELISEDPELINEVQDIINTPAPTTGGPVMWDTLAEAYGWRLQRNKLTGHGRILDPSNTRQAWGDLSKLKNNLRELVENHDANSTNTVSNNTKGNSDVIEKLSNLKKLLDAGAISTTEYEKLKSDLIN